MLTKNHWYLNADGVIVSFHRKSQIALNPLKNNYKKYELRVDGKVVDRHEYKGGMFEDEGKMFAIIDSGEPVALRVDIREDASLERDPILGKMPSGRWFRIALKIDGEWMSETEETTMDIRSCSVEELKQVLLERSLQKRRE